MRFSLEAAVEGRAVGEKFIWGQDLYIVTGVGQYAKYRETEAYFRECEPRGEGFYSDASFEASQALT